MTRKWVPDPAAAHAALEKKNETIARIVAKIRVTSMVGGSSEPTYRCACRNRGVVMVTSGRFNVGNEDRDVFVHATEDFPVARRCVCNPVQAEDTRKRRTGTYS